MPPNEAFTRMASPATMLVSGRLVRRSRAPMMMLQSCCSVDILFRAAIMFVFLFQAMMLYSWRISFVSTAILESGMSPSHHRHAALSKTTTPWKCMSDHHHQHQQVLGILLVGKADVFTIRDWLHRHHALFEMLVAIDGSESARVGRLLNSYPNVRRLDESIVTKNATKITDQTIRKPAMSVFGNPVGCWIMICHPDEFWVVDPRRLTQHVANINRTSTTKKEKRDLPYYNVISVAVLTASPMESEYRKRVKDLYQQHQQQQHQRHDDGNEFNDFHIVEVSKFTSPYHKVYKEERFVLWEDGMRWGTSHSKVVPKHIPNGGQRTFLSNDYFYVHFKMHDFGSATKGTLPAAVNETTGKFVLSKLNTGLKQSSKHGWRGIFLDVTEPEELRKYPPESLVDAVEKRCQSLVQIRSPTLAFGSQIVANPIHCDLPWALGASFR